MKHTKRQPCKECPFLKGAMRGFLGTATPTEFLRMVHGEGGLPCHMSMQAVPQDASGRVDVTDCQQCVGAIHHANLACKLYQPGTALRAQQDRLAQGEMPDGVLGLREFLDYHTLE